MPIIEGVYWRFNCVDCFIQAKVTWLDKPAQTLYNSIYCMKCNQMSLGILLTRDMDVSPRIAVGILLGILIMRMFVVGYDQGHLYSVVQGQEAFDTKWMHEFYHDMRHAAGFPCH